MSTIRPQRPGLAPSTDPGRALDVEISGPSTSFGGIVTASFTPTAQVDFIDNIINTVTNYSLTYGGDSSAAVINGELNLSSGTNSSGYSFVSSRRAIVYQPGQGTTIRLTGRFDTPRENTEQWVGGYNGVSGYRFGYEGLNFGIQHIKTATREIRTLTIATPSSTASNATITLNGQSTTIALTASGSTTQTAYEVARQFFYNIADGWFSMAIGSTVVFIGNVPKPYSGSFSFSHATAAGTFSLTSAGVSPTKSFIPISSWNIDSLDGSGPSGMIIDPQKGNVFDIQYQYLGYGDAYFAVEDYRTGKFTPVHIIRNANNVSSTVLRDPALFISWEAKNTGSTATGVTVRGASGAGFVDGERAYLGPNFSYSAEKTATSNGTVIPVLTVRASLIFNNRALYSPIRLNRLTASAIGSSGKPIQILVYENAFLTGANFSKLNDSTSKADVDTAATAINTSSNGARLIASMMLSTSGQDTINFTYSLSDLPAGSWVTVCFVNNVNNNASVAAALEWTET